MPRIEALVRIRSWTDKTSFFLFCIQPNFYVNRKLLNVKKNIDISISGDPYQE